MSTISPEAPPVNGGKFAAATVGIVGAVTVLAEFVIAAMFGVANHLNWSSGAPAPGVIAVVAAIAMAARCTSWAEWRKWIWLPIGIAITAVFTYVAVAAQPILREEARVHQAQARQAKIDRDCKDLSRQLGAKAAEIKASRALKPSWESDGIPAPSWETDGVPAPSWSSKDLPAPHWADDPVTEYNDLVDKYNASCVS